MHKTRGFTLLEAVVALAILSAGTMATFAVLSGALRSIERVEAALRAQTAGMNALAFVETINPLEQPSGEIYLGDARVSWDSRLAAPVVPALTDYLQLGLFDVGLYDVHVAVVIDDSVERRFVVRRAGWVQAREPEVL